MFVCFKCLASVEDYKDFCEHLKDHHNLSANSTYRCKQYQCDREYQNVRSFRRHLISQHLNKQTNFNQNLSTVDCALSENIHDTCSLLDPCESHEYHPLNNVCRENALATAHSMLEQSAATLALSLFSDGGVNRKTALKILDNIQLHITQVLGDIFKHVMPIYNEFSQSEIDNIHKLISNPFGNIRTEYQILKYFTNINCYIAPEQYIINETVADNTVNTSVMLAPKSCTGAKLPLRSVFKKIFELPNFYKLVSNTLNLNEVDFPNFAHSLIWQKKIASKEGKLCCPFFMYFDDFECNNPLGSHVGVHSISAVYYQFPTMPHEYLSLLDNVFVAMLYNSYFKIYGNHSAFYELIKELKYLEEEGIDINTENGKVKIYFILGMILGDNLGLNTILGFSKSFSSNYYCRICKSHKSIMKKQTKADNALLRDQDNYANDLEQNNVTETGISEYCCFNNIPSFHVVDNCCVDIMHDIFEGVCHYDLAHIILYYTQILHCFDLTTLNNRLKLFDYSVTELNNKSVCIKQEHLVRSKFKMSASEMLMFVHLFPLLVGDLVPSDDPVWQFLIILLKIIQIILCSVVDAPTVKLLESLITEHHENYINLFNDTLKPKHHLMLHYPHIIEQVGPLKQLWCMRFEAKHKTLKNTAQIITSRKNICLTLLIKEQLAFANRLFLQKGLESRVELGKITVRESHVDISHINDTSNQDVDLSCDFQWIRFRGTKYNPGMILVTTNENDFFFYKLERIFRSKYSMSLYFLCKSLKCSGFNDHFQAYSIQGENDSMELLKPEHLIISPTNVHVIATGESYCRFSYY